MGILSAAILSELGTSQGKHADIRQARDWIVSKGESGVATVIVLKSADKWFGERETKNFGEVLRAILDRLEWQSSHPIQSDGQSRRPDVIVAFIFDSAPPKVWN